MTKRRAGEFFCQHCGMQPGPAGFDRTGQLKEVCSLIKDLPDGELIQEPGFYRISLERHHSQPCDGPSITSSVLRKMETWTPADVWASSSMNPARTEKEDTDALRKGRAMAAFVEGGRDCVLQSFLLLPEDAPKRPTAAQRGAVEKGTAQTASIEAVRFWAAVEADGRPLVTQSEMAEIEAMGAALVADAGAAAVMEGLPEISMAWQDEETGIWLLSRPDTVAMSGVLTDYKRMNTQGRPFNTRLVDSRITEHGYDQQMALAADVFERLTGSRPEAAIVAQWDKAPYHVVLRPISDEDLRIGSLRNRRALVRFKECLESNYWPGPGEHVGAYQRPDWQREMLLQQFQTEGVSP